MKKFLSMMVVALLSTAMSFAQSSLIATLSHEGEISVYYGATALSEAHKAQEGDVITLSSGSFNAVDITKGITIRGAGMEVNSTTGAMPTVISGDFKITTTSGNLTIEGIYHNNTMYYQNTLSTPRFIKCRFSQIDWSSSGIIKDAQFVHCKIVDKFNLDGNSSAQCISCVVTNPINGYSSSSFEFINCVLYARCSKVDYSLISNCVVDNWYDASAFPASTTLYNNVGATNGGSNPFSNSTNSSNTAITDYNEFMTTFWQHIGVDNLSFQLTDEAKKAYLGTDGTEVGIYGGSLPFDPTPSNPQITKCNVAAKSTADGKLSVDIEVNGAE